MAKYQQETISTLMDERDLLAKALWKIANMSRNCGGANENPCCGCVVEAIDKAAAVLKALGLQSK